jgi:hypothetical protein
MQRLPLAAVVFVALVVAPLALRADNIFEFDKEKRPAATAGQSPAATTAPAKTVVVPATQPTPPQPNAVPATPTPVEASKVVAGSITVQLNVDGRWSTLESGAQIYTDKKVNWTAVPDDLRGRSFSALNHYLGKTSFEVTSGGTVLLACTERWGGGGNAGGGWKAELTTREQLEAEGWRAVGTLEGDKMKWVVFSRNCKAGERFTVRTEKYCAPIVIR